MPEVGMRLADALRRGPLVLDGGLATWLEAAGHDLRDALWSARLLADDPAAVVAAHRAFLDAGASVITTASYQATIAGFVARGHAPDEAARLIRSSVELARAPRDQGHPSPPNHNRPLWIAASVGPYGAALADGSEYRGNYGLSHADLVRFHRPRVALLADAGPDVLALETVPDIREAEALSAAIGGIGVPAWLSYTIDGDRTRAGQPLTEAFAVAAGCPEIVAVGVNCSSPEDATDAVPLAAQVTGKPVVVYPNSGERWDATARRWTATRPGPRPLRWSAEHRSEGASQERTAAPNEEFALLASRWVHDGARLIGGCCRVGPATIARIAHGLRPRREPPAGGRTEPCVD